MRSVRLNQCAWWSALILSRPQAPQNKRWAHTSNFRGGVLIGPTLAERESPNGFLLFHTKHSTLLQSCRLPNPKPAIQDALSNPGSICCKPPMRCMRKQ